jgi:hypothetical protein
MKAVALVAVVLAAVLPHGKGKGTPADCARFNLKGTLASPSAASFLLQPPDSAKRPASPVRIAITATTEIFWASRGTMGGPQAGDRVWARGRHCGSTYTATWVLVTAQK